MQHESASLKMRLCPGIGIHHPAGVIGRVIFCMYYNLIMDYSYGIEYRIAFLFVLMHRNPIPCKFNLLQYFFRLSTVIFSNGDLTLFFGNIPHHRKCLSFLYPYLLKIKQTQLQYVYAAYKPYPTVAITFSSIAIGVGKLVIPNVVRQGKLSLKYSA